MSANLVSWQISNGDHDEYLGQLAISVQLRLHELGLLDMDSPPSREGLAEHQVWVWLGGAPIPHWAIRGTGAQF